MRVRTLIATTVATLGLSGLGCMLPGVASAAPSKVICPPVGVASVDPIRLHGLPASTPQHQHQFFSNRVLPTLPNPNAAEYNQLVGQATSCQNRDDTAAYWAPTLVFTSGTKVGQLVPFRNFFGYYRCFNGANSCPVGTDRPHAPDTRLIAGNAFATASQDTRNMWWSCGDTSSRARPFPDIVAAACNTATGTVFLTAHMNFPTCWDGQLADHNVVGDTQDTAHFRYTVNKVCPAGFPIRVPQLRTTVKWDYRGNGQDVALSSDLMQRDMGIPTPAGRTFHSDFWQTWVMSGGVQGGYPQFIIDCVERNITNQARCG